MANKSLTDLTARTATADSDLIHVNSGGTDYKETKLDFLRGKFYHEFGNSTLLTSQADNLPNIGTYFGKLNGWGHQTETGLPINADVYVEVLCTSANYKAVEIWSVNDIDGLHYTNTKNNGTWGGWVRCPARSEITSLNNSLTQCYNYFTSVGSVGEVITDLNGAYTGMTADGKLSIVRYYASSSSAHAPVNGDGLCITYRITASYGVQFVLCNIGIYVRYVNYVFGQWKQISSYN